MTGEGSDASRRDDQLDGMSPARAPETLRLVAPALKRSILRRIREALPVDGEMAPRRRCQLVELAAEVVVGTFVEHNREGDPDGDSQRRKADELYRRIGYLEARHDRDQADLDVALEEARRAGWQHLSDAVSDDSPSKTLSELIDAWHDHIDHLRDEVLAGRSLWPGATSEHTATRQTLLARLMDNPPGRISPRRPLGVDADKLTSMAESAHWVVPEHVVALVVSFHGTPPEPPDRSDLLWTVRRDRLLLICPDQDANELADLLLSTHPGLRVAISWPVPPTEAGSALLWANRALDLVRVGVIPPAAIVACAEHATQIWLHAEPSMRQHLCQQLLEPLLAETPNSREILSETLLAWLETRDSAPAIASRLDVHPQTIRYRWKRIYELFGNCLDDPEFVIQVTLVLKASVHLWRAGHQDDFDRFRGRSKATR